MYTWTTQKPGIHVAVGIGSVTWPPDLHAVQNVVGVNNEKESPALVGHHKISAGIYLPDSVEHV
jgi:hypothetical protein